MKIPTKKIYTAFWITSQGKLLNCEQTYHAGDIVKYPDKFNLTLYQLKEINSYNYQAEYCDDLNILLIAFYNGFIKIRQYIDEYFISSPHSLKQTKKLIIKSNIIPDIIYETKMPISMTTNNLDNLDNSQQLRNDCYYPELAKFVFDHHKLCDWI